MRNKQYLRIAAAGMMAAGILSLSACQTSGSGTTTAATEAQTTEPAAETSEGAGESSGAAETTKAAGESSDAAQTTEAAGKSGAEKTTTAAAKDVKTLFGSFQSITLDGEDITEDIFGESKLTMVNIWGTFCGPCIMEMPDLAEISQEHDTADFQIVGIVTDAADANNPDAVAIVEETGADYTHIMLSQSLVDGYVGTVQAVPTTVFVDNEGKQVGKVYMGAKSKAQWDEIISGLMTDN